MQWTHLVLFRKKEKRESPGIMQWVHLVLLTKDRKTEVSGYNAMGIPGAVNKG